MKTNKILMAVALPALLAACTAEEVVEQSPVANLSGRAVLDSNFSVNVAEGIDSRFAWEGLNWKYEAGDQFGAGVVDPAELGTISDASMIGNYIFVKNAAGAYKTNSQMQEGTYMFYSYGGFDKKNVRSLVSFDITSQKTDLNEPEAMINEYANQLMFSPLYEIEAEYSAEPMPLEFRSFWGVAAFKFKNNSGQTLRINQIVLKEAGASKFVVKGGINPKAINDAGLKYVYNEKGAKYNGTEGKANEHNYVPVSVSNLIDDKDLTEAKRLEKIEDAYEAFEKAYYNTALSKDVTGNGSASFIAMNCQNYKMKHGETVTAYMLVPEHKGKNLSVEIMVVDEEDESWSVFVEDENVDGTYGMEDSKEVEELDELAILRHKTNAIFGKTTDGKGMKTLSITEDDLQENSGYYIDNNDALIDLINANLGKILVHNTGDTYIDAEVIKAIKEYTGTHVTFSNVIEIKDAEALVDDADTETELALTQITFNGGAVVKGESEKNEIDGTVEFGKNIVFGAGQTLTIEEGANVTLNKGSYKNIKNSGNLTIVGAEDNGSRAVEEYDGKVTNLAGTLTLKGTTPEVNMKAGSLNYVALNKKTLLVESGDLTIAAGVELTIGEYVTFEINNDMAIANLWKSDNKGVVDFATWTNNGTINIASDAELLIEGTLVNNGEIVGGELHAATIEKYVDKTYRSTATINNNDDAEIRSEKIAIDYRSAVNNYGDFLADNVINNGKITMMDEKAHVNVTSGTGEINNTANGIIEELPEGMLVSATVGAMTDGEELDEFETESGINKIYVTGRWTITNSKTSENERAEVVLERLGIKTIEFVTKDAMYLRDGATLDLANIEIIVSSVPKVVFTGYNDNVLTIGEIKQGLWWNSNIEPYGDWEETAYDLKHIVREQSAESVAAAFAGEDDVVLLGDVVSGDVLKVTADKSIDLADYTLNGSISIAADKEVVISNGVVENKNPQVSGITSNGDLELTDVEVVSARHALRIESGNVVINSGEYTVLGTEGMTTYALNIGDTDTEAVVTIKGGKFVGPAGSPKSDSGAAVLVKKGSTLIIEDGDFSGGKIKTISGEGNIVVKGGTFDQNPIIWVAKGYQVVEKNGKFIVEQEVTGK